MRAAVALYLCVWIKNSIDLCRQGDSFLFARVFKPEIRYCPKNQPLKNQQLAFFDLLARKKVDHKKMSDIFFSPFYQNLWQPKICTYTVYSYKIILAVSSLQEPRLRKP
jgi:hypothetical protein